MTLIRLITTFAFFAAVFSAAPTVRAAHDGT
jgi:hypothetical protein